MMIINVLAVKPKSKLLFTVQDVTPISSLFHLPFTSHNLHLNLT